MQSREEYKSFRDEKGHLPVYRTHEALIEGALEYKKLFELCLNSLNDLDYVEVKILQSDIEAGKIVVLTKVVRKWFYRGETVEFDFSKSPDGSVRVDIKSYSNVRFKGMASVSNLKNLYGIYEYLNRKLNKEEIGVSLTLAYSNAW